MLRIDINLLFTVINVLILFVAVRLLLWKPIHKILAERQAQADAGMEQAAEKRAEAEALAAQHQLQLDSIAQERTAALEEARSQAQAESQRILAAARDQAEGIVAQAQQDAQRRHDEIMHQTQEEISEIILTATAKVTGVGGDSELYDAFLQKAGNGNE